MRAVVQQWRKAVNDTLLPAVEALLPVHLDDNADDVDRLMGHLKISFAADVHPEAAKAYLIDVGQRTAKWNDEQWKNTLHTVLGVDTHRPEQWLGSHIKSFANENTSLITKLSTETLTNVRRVVETGVRKGDYYTDLKKQIQETMQTTEYRARLIARDQIGKLNGELTQLRQQEAGIEGYIWRTAQDERVRGDPSGLYPNATPSHFDREGQRFRWDDPPEGGHPGEAIQCRCTAEPVFTEAPAAEPVEPEAVPLEEPVEVAEPEPVIAPTEPDMQLAEVGRRKVVEAEGIRYMLPRRASKAGDRLLLADIDKLDKLFKAEPAGVYIGAADEGMRGRRKGFQEFLATGKVVEVPEVHVNAAEGYAGFTNGRHRFAVLRDSGKKTMYVAVSKANHKTATKMIGAKKPAPAKKKRGKA